MKRSTCVQLVLLGSAVGLYGCDGAPQQLQRQRYASLDECRHDWGDPADCTQGSAGTGSGYYFGPRYYWDPSFGRPVVVAPDGSTRSIVNSRISSAGSRFGGVTESAGSFARGGFGSIAHALGGARS
jgi:hypothetical protein